MGFHKRRITYDWLRSTYENSGIPGLKTLLSADALIIPIGLDIGQLYQMIDNEEEDKVEEWIKQLPAEDI